MTLFVPDNQGVTETVIGIAACGFSCQTQIAHLNPEGNPAPVHLAQLLSRAMRSRESEQGKRNSAMTATVQTDRFSDFALTPSAGSCSSKAPGLTPPTPPRWSSTTRRPVRSSPPSPTRRRRTADARWTRPCARNATGPDRAEAAQRDPAPRIRFGHGARGRPRAADDTRDGQAAARSPR